MATWRHERHGDMATCRHVDMRTWRHSDMRTCGHADMRSPGRPWVAPSRPRSCFFSGVDYEIGPETIINGISMPWSFGCTKRRPKRMTLKPFYGTFVFFVLNKFSAYEIGL